MRADRTYAMIAGWEDILCVWREISKSVVRGVRNVLRTSAVGSKPTQNTCMPTGSPCSLHFLRDLSSFYSAPPSHITLLAFQSIRLLVAII
ncbi:hypothetical protein M404DRAFT_743114 [Pisolithus tinctorius Marx 270]|uniref:Uncharacterized protein n=1 Tax=Pisolithus tinctorius Marx 270 TaxID=870435 RepID=A0A0C3P0V8_PISTI|nr:hypothetical protein M404DRAFT_743114 [Pisolithus tinctorius Marx 270]